MKLSESLYLEGQSSIEIILGNADGKANEKYELVKTTLQKEVEPALKEYLKSLNIKESIAHLDTIELLEKVEIDFIPLHIKTLVADTIDTLDFAEYQKSWLFAVFLTSFFQGASAFATTILQARAQEIMNKKRIIH